MPVTVHNPYSGKDDDTCSVSFAAQQKVVGGVSSQQTEAEYNASKLLGEWGVLKAKVATGQIATGTKLMTFADQSDPELRGYLYAKGQAVWQKVYHGKHLIQDQASTPVKGEGVIKANLWNVAIPSASPAAATPSTPVNSGSDSAGSMSHEDVAAMFVKIKDDLAKEKGLNIKGANPELDQLVYTAIGEKTGYTTQEIKGKIEAYKAGGNKLSALKKKVLLGTKKVPDPKPNGVPTKVTATVTNAAKTAVEEVVAAKPAKHYSDEDVAAQYIIAKDAVVAASNGKYTLYSKSDQMDKLIYDQVNSITGLNKDQAQVAIANYLGSGKKLSTLKKQLAKQGAFEPKADTLKKSGAEKDLAAKADEVIAKADAGYTPTPTPSSAGSPPVDTGKPAPQRVVREAATSGAIEHITEANQKAIYASFKAKGNQAYLSASNESTYEALLSVQTTFKANGQDYTLLQLLRVIDSQGALKFKAENTKLFEKKTATWLTTPAASDFIKAQEAKLAKLAAQAELKAEAEKAAKLLEANQPPLPADSALFQDWSIDKARRVSKTWLEAKPWTAKEQRDLKHYTGSSYVEMNGHLRDGSPVSDRSKTAIEGARSGMRPTTEPILVKRGTGLGQFSSLGVGHADSHVVWGLAGKTFKDEGFLSTSAGGRAAFGGQAVLEIECPVGTPMAYVAPISRYPNENEMLLQAGMEYKILNIRQDNGKFLVRLRVVNWPGKEN